MIKLKYQLRLLSGKIMIVTSVILFLSINSYSQPVSDSTRVLTVDQLLWFIDNYHPVVKQAELFKSRGESYLRKARGGFDPYVFSNFNNKQFANKEYFSMLSAGLKVPTWYGVELKTGFDQNAGTFLNAENTVPNNGLWYAGASVSLGQGLLMDKRRATLKKAKLYNEVAEAQQIRMINDLYFEALGTYWRWISDWNQFQIFSEAVKLAEVRFQGVRQSYLQGANPAIDTLEATIQIQNRVMSRNQAQLDYINTTLELSNFLWFENEVPLEITEVLTPPSVESLLQLEPVSEDSLHILIELALEYHPDLQMYDYKLSALEIERKLKAEALKPRVDINYNFLQENVGSNVLAGFSTENYKWGVDFSFPIFIRKQRGDLQLTNFDIAETSFGEQQKSLEISNKIRSYYNEQLTLKSQVDLYSSAVENYSRLLAGERQKFFSGESSLFLINSREVSLITAQLKWIELVTKYNKAQNGLMWAAGLLVN